MEEYLIEYKTCILSSSVLTAEEQANGDTGLGSRHDLNLEIYWMNIKTMMVFSSVSTLQ